jgi:heme exporter protein A
MSTGPAIELQGIARLYGRSVALRALDLRLGCGETLAVLGRNGSGKTTLLKILAGAITPTLGRGAIFGRDIIRERPVLRGQVGLLAAETYLYDDLTARENLRFILAMSGRKPIEPDIVRVAREVELDEQLMDRVGTFSSGMKRRLALARALLLSPELLLLDEPYNNLDEVGSGLVDEVVRGRRQRGMTTVLATHDAGRALTLADRVLELERGAAVYKGVVGGYGARRAHYVG